MNRILLPVIVLSCLTPLSALALEGPGRALVPAATLQASVDAILNGAAGDPVQRAFIPPYSGTVRVRWEARSGDGTVVFAQAWVNNLDVCYKTTTSKTFAPLGCDVRVAAGMPLIVSGLPDAGNNTVSLRNVRVYYKVTDSDGKMTVYNDFVGQEAATAPSGDQPR